MEHSITTVSRHGPHICPGLVVAYPSTPANTEGQGLMKSALRGEDPVIFLMHKKLSALRGEVGGADDLVPFGKANVVRQGSRRHHSRLRHYDGQSIMEAKAEHLSSDQTSRQR